MDEMQQYSAAEMERIRDVVLQVGRLPKRGDGAIPSWIQLVSD